MSMTTYIIIGIVTLAAIDFVLLTREQLSRWRTRRLLRRRGLLGPRQTTHGNRSSNLWT
ncbi:MAG: hypothetical protein M1376_10915 [Planctomycetes bacterium]|nr:hypothetical protein [Planctomycetota bacterium]